MRTLSLLAVGTAFLALTAATPVMADEWHDHGDIHHFHEHDYDHWRAGSWFHGIHDGRDGWWWTVDGIWYYYPAPVYPYPDPYTPPTVVVTPAPAAPVIGAPSSVYYCGNPVGYYPYVPQCYEPWQRVASPTTVIVQQPAAPVAVAPAGTREADEHQLNAYAAQLQAIDINSPHARTDLRRLEKKVASFRQSLFKRSYNAMDILANTEDLQHRITAERNALSAVPPVGVVPPPSSAPPPSALPPSMPPPQ